MSWVCLLVGLLSTTRADSLVANGGFEDVQSPGQPIAVRHGPVSWTATVMDAAARFGVDEEIAHSGERSAYVETRPGRRVGRFHFNWFQRLSLTPGQSYRLSGVVRCEGQPNAAFVVVQLWENPSARDGRLLGISAARAAEGPLCSVDGWVAVGSVFSVPRGTTAIFLKLGVGVVGLGGRTDFGGKAWFDDVAIEPVAP